MYDETRVQTTLEERGLAFPGVDEVLGLQKNELFFGISKAYAEFVSFGQSYRQI